MKIFIVFMSLAPFLLTSCATRHKPEKKNEIKHSGFTMPNNEESVTKLIENWPAASKAAANSMRAKYGLPAIASSDMLIWYDTGDFKRTVVNKEEVKHAFPIPHSDVLQQTIHYRVPRDKVSEISELDGSLLVDRTKGEITARNDKEAINYLAFNLADQIVRGTMTVSEARYQYSRMAHNFASGETNRYLTGLNFKIEGDTTDPDQQLIQAQEEADSVEDTLQR